VAEIRNYTMNFASGRPAAPGLTCAARKLEICTMNFSSGVTPAARALAFTEVHGVRGVFGGGV
jgi:hypothetical protein